MKTKLCLSLLSPSLLPIVLSAAIMVDITRSVSISDNDSVSTGDAGYDSTPPVIGSTSATLNNLSENAELGYRFTAFNSGRGVNNVSQQVRSITQSINVWVEWEITADSGETYDFSITPELRAYLNISDDSSGESGDQATLSTFNASLTQNGSSIGDSLNLSGGSRTSVGSSNLNDTASQTFTDLTGINTFRLSYSGSSTAAWKIAGFRDNRTASAVLLGQDGTMDGDVEFSDSFDNYSTSTARNADGLFVSGTVELTAVPEPAAAALMVSTFCLALTGLRRRR